jgi:hypothetical protein
MLRAVEHRWIEDSFRQDRDELLALAKGLAAERA